MHKMVCKPKNCNVNQKLKLSICSLTITIESDKQINIIYSVYLDFKVHNKGKMHFTITYRSCYLTLIKSEFNIMRCEYKNATFRRLTF